MFFSFYALWQWKVDTFPFKQEHSIIIIFIIYYIIIKQFGKHTIKSLVVKVMHTLTGLHQSVYDCVLQYLRLHFWQAVNCFSPSPLPFDKQIALTMFLQHFLVLKILWAAAGIGVTHSGHTSLSQTVKCPKKPTEEENWIATELHSSFVP